MCTKSDLNGMCLTRHETNNPDQALFMRSYYKTYLYPYVRTSPRESRAQRPITQSTAPAVTESPTSHQPR